MKPKLTLHVKLNLGLRMWSVEVGGLKTIWYWSSATAIKNYPKFAE